MNNLISTRVVGHVHIEDGATGEVLLDGKNAVHSKNLAIALARGLSHSSSGTIYQIKLGNGGTAIDGTGQITYQSPNVTAANASLYNATYSEVIDANLAGTPSDNSVFYQSAADDTAIVICTATIAAGEPAGQATTDTSTTTANSQYAFDELGLFTDDGLLLSHLIFSPILKTQNRELVITYTLTISVQG